MAGGSESYHEPVELLSDTTKDMHRALVSAQEELEAIDWYQQRADATTDQELKGLLLHNMREEMEHACMMLEWLRRNSADLDEQMRVYLFSDSPILEAEEAAESDAGEEVSRHRSLDTFTIGDMKGKKTS